MSVILDALRRKPDDRLAEHNEPKNARSDAVLATLGYPRSAAHARVPIRTMLLYGAAAVIVGFAGLSAVILMLAPSRPSRPTPARPAPVSAAGAQAQSTATATAAAPDAHTSDAGDIDTSFDGAGDSSNIAFASGCDSADTADTADITVDGDSDTADIAFDGAGGTAFASHRDGGDTAPDSADVDSDANGASDDCAWSRPGGPADRASIDPADGSSSDADCAASVRYAAAAAVHFAVRVDTAGCRRGCPHRTPARWSRGAAACACRPTA